VQTVGCSNLIKNDVSRFSNSTEVLNETFLQGYKVFGIFMRNWDPNDEAGSVACSLEQDYADAERVCKHLGESELRISLNCMRCSGIQMQCMLG
jgi:hypothetical protein